MVERQTRQETEIDTLRELSARLLERWLQVGVVGQGELWADWDDRVKIAERSVRRKEATIERENH